MVTVQCARDGCDTHQTMDPNDIGFLGTGSFWITVLWPDELASYFCDGVCLSRWAVDHEELTESQQF